uniref:Apple domain-containing protein n=1 Tax=Panagrellus redivivus TaxID=6233 RepID=A0A7E4ZQP9_PANRE
MYSLQTSLYSDSKSTQLLTFHITLPLDPIFLLLPSIIVKGNCTRMHQITSLPLPSSGLHLLPLCSIVRSSQKRVESNQAKQARHPQIARRALVGNSRLQIMLIECFGAVLLLLVPVVCSVSSSCFYLPNIALRGGTYDEFPANDIQQCCVECARSQCCLAYTFDSANNRCYMKAAITDSIKTAFMTSGLKANANNGQGCSLRNIRIQGGTAQTIKLPRTEDCLQYCTSYGIFSWDPPAKDSEHHDGDCSCMTRISSLEYSWGSRSAIIPQTSTNK